MSLFPLSPSRLACRLLLAAGLLLGAGCKSFREDAKDRALDRKYFVPTNYTGEAQLPGIVRRVLLLPVCGGSVTPPETTETIEEVFATELQQQLRFEVVRLSRTECMRRFGAPEFSSAAALPHDFLAELGRDYGADAVLFVDLTAYRAYRPLALGVRAKLATVEQTRLLWSFDQIFSADDPAVSNSVRRYYGTSDTSGIPYDPGYGALQSPGKFAAYVAAATFKTLPAR
jgi:hypothetical protein